MEVIKMEERKAIKCPLCNKETNFKNIFFRDNVFAGSQIFELSATTMSKENLNYGRGDCVLDIKQCSGCGLIYNASFNHRKIQQVYLNEKYMQQKIFSTSLNNILLNIKNKIMSYSEKDDIFLEIAPGLGDLFYALAKEVKFIYGVDPSPSSSSRIKGLKNAELIQDFFDENIKNRINKKVNFIIFRHLLEHIDTPKILLQNVVDFLLEDGKIYIEVPNALEIFKHKRFYEFFHDHVNYFQPNVLINIFNELGCECIDIHYPSNEQWVGLFFKKTKKIIRQNLEIYYYDNGIFQDNIDKTNTLLDCSKNIAIMGGGIHANSILNYLAEDNLKNIICAFDANPEKIGRFLQNSDIEIMEITKESLKDIECIIMAMPVVEEKVFENEILNFKKQGLAPKLKAVILSAKELRLVNLKENGC